MKMDRFDIGDSEGMAKAMGPGVADTMIRGGIKMCWVMMPKDKKTVEYVETEARRLVERALRDLREDAQAFGVG
ncbi:MAG: hypothetical protein KAT11_03780 [Phycisphaerae bacterium]|nr:hypothetical protein [Phycisphaerae bacterium]